MAFSITEVLNRLADMGVFSYVFPFMIIFAIVFGLLQKTKIFGDENKSRGINAIIAVGIGFLSLLNETVPTFFASIFPKFGVGLAVFLVIIILVGFFLFKENGDNKKELQWMGWVIGILIVFWAFNEWGYSWFGGTSFGYLLEEYIPIILVLAVVGFGIYKVVGGGGSSEGKPTKV